jgi:ATP-dependent 26S proteasome regulatory subunit
MQKLQPNIPNIPIEGKTLPEILLVRLFYLGNMFKTSFRQFFTNGVRKLNISPIVLVLVPIILSYTFFGRLDLKDWLLSASSINFPGVHLKPFQLSWETFQKTQYFFTPQTPAIFYQSRINTLNEIFFNYSVQSVRFWEDSLILNLRKSWKSLKKQQFLGIKYKPSLPVAKYPTLESKHILVFQAKEIADSNSITSERSDDRYCELDEFPKKLLNQINSDLTETLSVTPNENNQGKQFVLSKNSRLSFETDLKSTQQSSKHSSLIGIRKITPTKQKRIKNPLLQSKVQNDFFEKNDCLFETVNSLFADFNYVTPNSVFEAEIPDDSDLLSEKFSLVPSSEILTYLENLPNLPKSIEGFDENLPNLVTKKTLINISNFATEENLTNISKVLLINIAKVIPIDVSEFIPITIDKVLPINISKVIPMSGFSYPDMSTFDILELRKLNKFVMRFANFSSESEKRNLQTTEVQKIRLGYHFSHPKSYFSANIKPEVLKLKYFLAQLRNLREKLVYYGPVIREGEIAQNEVLIHKNLRQILNEKNPTQLEVIRFDSEMPSDVLINLRFAEEEEEDNFETLIIEQEPTIEKDPEYAEDMDVISLNFIPKSRYVVAGFSLDDWNDWLIFDKSNENNLIKRFPLRQVSIRKKSNGFNYEFFEPIEYNDNTWLKSLFKYKKSCQLELSHPESSYLASIEPLHIAKNAILRVNSVKLEDLYLTNNIDRPYHPFDKKTQPKFREPLHEQSWLAIGQYLMAAFMYLLLRRLLFSYGSEILEYLIELFAALGIVDETIKEELTVGYSSITGYKVTLKSTKCLHDIAGIEPIFMDISEIIWLLKTYRKSWSVKNNRIIQKGILLVGPPGTGKTLLVQAIGGEAGVPILAQSISALTSFEGQGPQRLQSVFEKAKQLSPCILFFDEIDSIGQKRTDLIDNSSGDQLLTLLTDGASEKRSFFPKMIPFSTDVDPLANREKRDENDEDEDEESKMNLEIQESAASSEKKSAEQLSLLMQLLIELDGVNMFDRFIVIGATNRAEVLDPALIRPGRFDRIFHLGLPTKQRRIQICQLYCQKMGVENRMDWSYIATKTVGLSGADLATIMNESTILAILNETTHTMKTIENSIDKIVSDIPTISSNEMIQNLVRSRCLPNPNNLVLEKGKDYNPSLIVQLAYYHSGTSIIQLILNELANPLRCSLLPKNQNSRYRRLVNQFWTQKLRNSTVRQMEAQVLNFCSGKMAETLYLNSFLTENSQSPLGSDFGQDDIKKALNLIYLIIDKWHFHSRGFLRDQMFSFLDNKNHSEFRDSTTETFLRSLTEKAYSDSLSGQSPLYETRQKWGEKASWQNKFIFDKNFSKPIAPDWFRICLLNPDETEFNEEWLPPDQYFHTDETFFLTKNHDLVSLTEIKRDNYCQFVFRNALRKAFNLLVESSEFLDFFVLQLIRNNHLELEQIQMLQKQFYSQEKTNH